MAIIINCYSDSSTAAGMFHTRFQDLVTRLPCMKLHEIQCHFREIPHAVAEHGLRPRRRPRPLSPIKF